MSHIKQWWELADGSLTPNKPEVWLYRYAMVPSVDGNINYWYIEPYTTRVISPINEQDLPKELTLVRFLLGDD